MALDELGDRRKFLESRLREVQNLELHRSIFRLLETQLAAETLINARKTFPLEEIQPAVPPLLKLKPKRLFTAAGSFIGFLFLGVTITIGSVLFRKISQGLTKYKTTSNKPKEPSIDKKKGIWQRYKDRTTARASAKPDEWID